jgi:hypothetical protein
LSAFILDKERQYVVRLIEGTIELAQAHGLSWMGVLRLIWWDIDAMTATPRSAASALV